MELLVEGALMSEAKVHALRDEAIQLTAIMAASRLTASRRTSIANRKLQIANQ